MGAWCHVLGPPDLASGHQRKFPGGGDNFHRYERRVDTVWLWPGKPGSPSITRMLLSWGTARPKVLAALRSHSCIAHGGKTVSRENMLCDYMTVCLCLYTDVPKTAFFKRNKAIWQDINTSSCTGPSRKKKKTTFHFFSPWTHLSVPEPIRLSSPPSTPLQSILGAWWEDRQSQSLGRGRHSGKCCVKGERTFPGILPSLHKLSTLVYIASFWPSLGQPWGLNGLDFHHQCWPWGCFGVHKWTVTLGIYSVSIGELACHRFPLSPWLVCVSADGRS